MMVIRGIYERHEVQSLNHGIGFDTAAIELLLPTYGESLGLKGKICQRWALNPHPTLIPAIESGWVESVHCFGSEVGMDEYAAARPNVFFTGRDGSLRLTGYSVSSLGNMRSMRLSDRPCRWTQTRTPLRSRKGAWPVLEALQYGARSHGRRHSSPAWLSLMASQSPVARGRKLVVQTVETFHDGNSPAFVEILDAVAVGRKAGMPLAPVMIYGDDVSHVVTEEGIAYLYKAEGQEERGRPRSRSRR